MIIMSEKNIYVGLVFPIVTIFLSCAGIAQAEISGSAHIVIELDNTDQAKQEADGKGGEKLPKRTNIVASRSGKMFIGDRFVETSEPVPVGWSWRPVVSVGVAAKIVPPGKFQFTDNSIIYPSGQLYVRCSPDAKH